MKNLSYNEIKQAINGAPTTWLPGLLLTAAQACADRQVFQPGGAARLVKRIESDASKTTTTPAPASPEK